MDQNILNIAMITQIILSGLLVISVMLQNRAEGLGSMFGGGGEIYRTKRGLEKFLYTFTIILAVAVSVLSLLIVKYS